MEALVHTVSHQARRLVRLQHRRVVPLLVDNRQTKSSQKKSYGIFRDVTKWILSQACVNSG